MAAQRSGRARNAAGKHPPVLSPDDHDGAAMPGRSALQPPEYSSMPGRTTTRSLDHVSFSPHQDERRIYANNRSANPHQVRADYPCHGFFPDCRGRAGLCRRPRPARRIHAGVGNRRRSLLHPALHGCHLGACSREPSPLQRRGHATPCRPNLWSHRHPKSVGRLSAGSRSSSTKRSPRTPTSLSLAQRPNTASRSWLSAPLPKTSSAQHLARS